MGRESAEQRRQVEDAAGQSCCSIFVSTRVGQIRNELAFIGSYGPVRPRALIMTPERDEQLRANMLRMVAAASQFEVCEVALLPDYPASARSWFKRPRVYAAMRDALEKLIGSSSRVMLYLHHPNRYYVYFERILDELGIESYELNMLEEGLATYRWGVPGLEDIESEARCYTPQESAARAGRELAAAVRSLLRAVLHLLKFVERLAELVLAVFSKLMGCNLFETAVRGLGRLLSRKYRFGLVPRFDNGYFCFPGKMRTVQAFEIGKLHKLPFAAEGAVSGSCALQDADAVFASQKYGNPELYYEAVLTVLEEMGLKSVCFKLHPREEPGEALPHLEKASRNHAGLRVIHDAQLDAVPLETLLAEQDCRLVVGLTTSTLMYLPLVDTGARPLSIAQRFFEVYGQLDADGGAGRGIDLKTFREDFQIFRAVAPEVEQFVPGVSSMQAEKGEASSSSPGAAGSGRTYTDDTEKERRA